MPSHLIADLSDCLQGPPRASDRRVGGVSPTPSRSRPDGVLVMVRCVPDPPDAIANDGDSREKPPQHQLTAQQIQKHRQDNQDNPSQQGGPRSNRRLHTSDNTRSVRWVNSGCPRPPDRRSSFRLTQAGCWMSPIPANKHISAATPANVQQTTMRFRLFDRRYRVERFAQ